MVFYCFPRIIGRVHREGKAIHQSTESEKEREERGQGEKERGMEGERGVGGISEKMERKIGEGRGKGGRKNRRRGREAERIRRA